MHANLRPKPRFKQRFEFGALGVRGSRWATDWPQAIGGLNELAHTAGAPCAGAPASVPCRSKESKKKEGTQYLTVLDIRRANGQLAESPPAPWRIVTLDSLRSSSFHNPPRGDPQEEHSTDEKSDMEGNI